MKKIILVLAILLFAAPVEAKVENTDLAQAFGKLSGVESALKNLSRQIDKTAGAETQPDRIYAMQDLSGMCKTSVSQVHSLNSLFSVVKLVKSGKRFQDIEADKLRKKCAYAFNDFSRRRAFVGDILQKAKDSKLKDLAHIFSAQLNLATKQLAKINNELNK